MTSDFKALQKEWYDKLKKEGFNDIEGATEDYVVRREIIKPPVVSAKIVMLELILHNYSDNLRDKDVELLSLYVNGKTVTEIATQLNTTHQAVSKRIRYFIGKHFPKQKVTDNNVQSK